MQSRERRRDAIRDKCRKELYPDLYGKKMSSGKRTMRKILPGLSNRDSSTLDPKEKELEDFYSIAIGAHPDNQQSNRYLCLEPYDRTRVIVPYPEYHRNPISRSNGNVS